MNKFVTWFHTRRNPIQTVIKLLLTLLILATLAGVVLLLFIPAGRWIFMGLTVAAFGWAIFEELSKSLK